MPEGKRGYCFIRRWFWNLNETRQVYLWGEGMLEQTTTEKAHTCTFACLHLTPKFGLPHSPVQSLSVPLQLSATTSKQDWTNERISSAPFPAGRTPQPRPHRDQHLPSWKRGERGPAAALPSWGRPRRSARWPPGFRARRIDRPHRGTQPRLLGSVVQARVARPCARCWSTAWPPRPAGAASENGHSRLRLFFLSGEVLDCLHPSAERCLWNLLVQRGWHLLPSTWDPDWASGNGR